MKVFALTVLVISLCYVQGGLVKRQAEEEPQGEVPTAFAAQFNEFIRRLQQETQGLATSIKESFAQTPLEEIRSQIDSAFQQLQDKFNPLTQQMRQNVAQLFTIPGRVEQAPEAES
ncbi:apolipoprotein A-II-like [Thamnophis elegans]|uniref:apolipoprotein A-II-like n=1 Tax=Thamnophis elegans TaxID=35005 RepID=UPI0013777FD6|nr:apolipoprotein A-II-like [Thamnophis elegans]